MTLLLLPQKEPLQTSKVQFFWARAFRGFFFLSVFKPERTIENDPDTGNPVIDEEAEGKSHTQLGEKTSSNTGEVYAKRRTVNENGEVVKEVEWTDHGRPQNHPNPHQHTRDPETGKRSSAEPLED